MIDRSVKLPDKVLQRRHRALLCVLSGVMSLVFVRLYTNERPFILQDRGDDAGYLAHSEALLRFHTWDWCAAPFTSRTLAEACATGRRPVFNKYAPGAPLLIVPINAVGVVLDRLHFLPPLPLDPLLLWSSIGAAVLLCGASLLLYAVAIEVGCSPRRSMAATVAFLVGNPVLYYVFRRPLMAHSAELFLFWWAVLCLLRWLHAGSAGRRRRFEIALGFACGLLALCRLNDLPVALAFFASVVVTKQEAPERLRSGCAVSAGALPPLLVLVAVVWAQLHGASIPQYDPPTHFAPLWPPTLTVLKRISDFFFGVHWGICLLMPFMLIEMATVATTWREVSARLAHRAPMVGAWILAALFQLYYVANFWSLGMSYGARYVFPIYYLVHVAFLLAIGARRARSRPLSSRTRWIATAVAACAVLVAALNLVSFESSEDLTMRQTAVSEEGVTNPEFAGFRAWAAPRFAANALANAASGRAFLAFGASPAAAYVLFGFQKLLGRVPPGAGRLRAYFEKRGIHGIGDLRVVMTYNLLVLLITGCAAGLVLLRRADRHANGVKSD